MEQILATVDVKMLVITAALIFFDIAFGLAGAIKNKDVDSGKLRQGLWHKSAFFGAIIFAYVLEFAAKHVNLGIEVPAVDCVCVYIILTEAVSIFENLCVINPELVNSPFGGIFKHDAKVMAAAAELQEQKKELAAGEEAKELTK